MIASGGAINFPPHHRARRFSGARAAFALAVRGAFPRVFRACRIRQK
jgi:hypothetical protein